MVASVLWPLDYFLHHRLAPGCTLLGDWSINGCERANRIKVNSQETQDSGSGLSLETNGTGIVRGFNQEKRRRKRTGLQKGDRITGVIDRLRNIFGACRRETCQVLVETKAHGSCIRIDNGPVCDDPITQGQGMS